MRKQSTSESAFSVLGREDINAPDALSRIFARPRLKRAFQRIVKADSDDFVTHPLKKPLLVEFEDTLCADLAQSIPDGSWRSEGAYLFLTHKRSGLFRELVFPTLVDSLVGRCLVDALEPQVTHDDDNKTFSGRTHFSNNRETGDYTSWFSVWRDFTAAVDDAASSAGFTYVYESDVSDFFPSIDRGRAIEMIAQRTGAHPSVLALLRYCLESWLPRVKYTTMSGIPIDCHDVSGLVAHNYLKAVDNEFKNREDCIYLRYVDDTVIFVPTDTDASEVARTHHMALRELGLSVSASKTRVLPTADYQKGRHQEANRRLERALKERDTNTLTSVVEEWYAKDRGTTESWDKVARRTYSVARQLRSEVMRDLVFEDVEQSPSIASLALRYLCRFDLEKSDLEALCVCLTQIGDRPDAHLALAQTCADGRFSSKCSAVLADTALRQIFSTDTRTPGIGYVKAIWLLVLFKHGNYRQRTDGLKALRTERDEHCRLHAALVEMAHEDRPVRRDLSLSTMETSDYQLLVKLCTESRLGRLLRPKRTLDACVSRVHGFRGIAARHLPLVAIVMQSEKHRATKERWLKEILDAGGRKHVRDGVVRRHVERWIEKLTA